MSDKLEQTPEALEEVVERIAVDIGLAKVNCVRRLSGGLVNHVYLLDTALDFVVLRMNKDCLAVFEKERWAMQQAQLVGVNVPDVLSIGESCGYCYMLMSYEEGDHFSLEKYDSEQIFCELGRLTRLINEIEVSGCGYFMDFSENSPRFTETWERVFEGEQEMIFRDDACVAIGALTRAESDLCRRFLEGKRSWKFTPRLCHGDLNLGNVLIQEGGKLIILDWTQAKGGPAPYFDLAAHCLRDRSEFEALCRGYGLSRDEIQVYLTNFHRVVLTDTMRAAAWAYSVEHPQLRRFVTDVQSIFAQINFS